MVCGVWYMVCGTSWVVCGVRCVVNDVMWRGVLPAIILSSFGVTITPVNAGTSGFAALKIAACTLHESVRVEGAVLSVV